MSAPPSRRHLSRQTGMSARPGGGAAGGVCVSEVSWGEVFFEGVGGGCVELFDRATDEGNAVWERGEAAAGFSEREGGAGAGGGRGGRARAGGGVQVQASEEASGAAGAVGAEEAGAGHDGGWPGEAGDDGGAGGDAVDDQGGYPAREDVLRGEDAGGVGGEAGEEAGGAFEPAAAEGDGDAGGGDAVYADRGGDGAVVRAGGPAGEKDL